MELIQNLDSKKGAELLSKKAKREISNCEGCIMEVLGIVAYICSKESKKKGRLLR